MASENLNRGVNNKFYDYFMIKDIEWLVDNAEAIVTDFYKNIDKYKFEIENANNFFPIFSKYCGKNEIKYSEKWIKEIIKEMKEEM